MNNDQISELITINTASIKSMQEKITALSQQAETLLHNDNQGIELSIEEIPANGNNLVVKPIYHPESVVQTDEGNSEPIQIGYAKIFDDVNNLPNTIQAFSLGIPTRVALTVIDVIIKALKNDIEKLRGENSRYIKQSS